MVTWSIDRYVDYVDRYVDYIDRYVVTWPIDRYLDYNVCACMEIRQQNTESVTSPDAGCLHFQQ